MSITTLESGKQQYTLLRRHVETTQTVICSYSGSPILTTDHCALVDYAKPLVIRDGVSVIYSIAMVTPIGHSQLHSLPLEEDAARVVGKLNKEDNN